MYTKHILSLSLITLISLSGCTSGSGTPDSGTSTQELGESGAASTTDESGLATISVNVGSRTNAIQLSTEASLGTVKLISITGPSGKQIVGEGTPIEATGAIQSANSPNVVNLPLPGESLSSGSYKVTYQTLKGKKPQAGSELTTKIFTKEDKDLSSGVVKVNIIKVGGVGGDERLVEGIDTATDVFKGLFSKAGISLDLKEYEFTGESTLPNPYVGDDFYTTVSNATRSGSINIVLGQKISNTSVGYSGSKYGIAGSAPGAASPSSRSAIAISIERITGGDNVFGREVQNRKIVENDEIRVLGEEMARLSALYLGLSNSVTVLSGTNIQGADLLSDTPSCLSNDSCKNSDARSNFMFPYPITKLSRDRTDITGNTSGDFYERGDVTVQQAIVLNSSLLVE